MTSAVDQKTYWGLGEIVTWIRTRDHERVAAMADLSEEEAMVRAMFADRARLDLRPLPRLLMNSEADRDTTAPQDKGKSSHIDGPIPMPPDQALDDLRRKYRSRRLPLTAIKCDGNNSQRMPVPPADLDDLIVRFTPGDRVAPVGLWSRSRRDTLVWRSPQFLRANGMRVWPARNTKTAAVYVAVLRHLREIMTSEAPLTKLEAQRRCLAEVPNAYPEAFKQAWVKLDCSCKRGRGKHGPRGR
jgi:hypothetical protein